MRGILIMGGLTSETEEKTVTTILDPGKVYYSAMDSCKTLALIPDSVQVYSNSILFYPALPRSLYSFDKLFYPRVTLRQYVALLLLN